MCCTSDERKRESQRKGLARVIFLIVKQNKKQVVHVDEKFALTLRFPPTKTAHHGQSPRLPQVAPQAPPAVCQARRGSGGSVGKGEKKNGGWVGGWKKKMGCRRARRPRHRDAAATAPRRPRGGRGGRRGAGARGETAGAFFKARRRRPPRRVRRKIGRAAPAVPPVHPPLPQLGLSRPGQGDRVARGTADAPRMHGPRRRGRPFLSPPRRDRERCSRRARCAPLLARRTLNPPRHHLPWRG